MKNLSTASIFLNLILLLATMSLLFGACNKKEVVTTPASELILFKVGCSETYHVNPAHAYNTTITKTNVTGTYYVHSNGPGAFKYVGFSYSDIVPDFEVEQAIESFESANPDDLNCDEPPLSAIHSFNFSQPLGETMQRIGRDWELNGKRINRPLDCPRACDK